MVLLIKIGLVFFLFLGLWGAATIIAARALSKRGEINKDSEYDIWN